MARENGIKMHSAHNERKPVDTEKLIIILKNKICKYMTSISKTMYFDKFDSLVNKYNNTYHSKIKIKSVDIKSSTYFYFNKETNKEDPKFKVSDHLSISKYRNIFASVNVPNWSVEVFVIRNVKNISNLKGEEIVEMFYEKEFQKPNQKESRIKNGIKRKGDKLYVNWKGYDHSFNTCIDKKEIAIKKMSYFPPYNHCKNKIDVKLDLSNYPTKSDLKTQIVLIHHNLLKTVI